MKENRIAFLVLLLFSIIAAAVLLCNPKPAEAELWQINYLDQNGDANLPDSTHFWIYDQDGNYEVGYYDGGLTTEGASRRVLYNVTTIDDAGDWFYKVVTFDGGDSTVTIFNKTVVPTADDNADEMWAKNLAISHASNSAGDYLVNKVYTQQLVGLTTDHDSYILPRTLTTRDTVNAMMDTLRVLWGMEGDGEGGIYTTAESVWRMVRSYGQAFNNSGSIGKWLAMAQMTEHSTWADALTDTLNDLHGAGSWGLTGNGDNTVGLYFKDSSTSAPLSARGRVWDTSLSSLYGDAIAAASTGLANHNLDDGTYTVVASISGYTARTKNFTTSADGDTFHIPLVELTLPASGTPEMCMVTAYLVDFVGATPESMLVEFLFEGRSAVGDGIIYTYREASDISDGSGVASVEVVRSSEINTSDGVTTYSVTIRDISKQRDYSDTRYAEVNFSEITIPDAASANLEDLVP
jgi:hypothetical protein